MDPIDYDERVAVFPCEAIRPRADNRALDDSLVEEIAESFECSTQAVPIIVRPLMDGAFELVDGHHRLAAKKLAARRYPANTNHLSINCIVRDLTDAEAEIQMAVANIQKPLTIAEKGRLYDRIGIRIDEMRQGNPKAFEGMDRGAAIAHCASGTSGAVSKATVYRSINAAHAEDGTHEYAGMTERQRKLVSRMRAKRRHEAQRILESDGQEGLDAWLDNLAVDEAQEAVSKCCMRIRSSCSEIRRHEKNGCTLDYSTYSLVQAIESVTPGGTIR